MAEPLAACVLVRHRDGRVLTVERPWTAGHLSGWHIALPGGKNEPGEDLSATAARELREETGLDVQPEHLVPVHAAVVPGDRAFRCTLYRHVGPDLSDATLAPGPGEASTGWTELHQLQLMSPAAFSAFYAAAGLFAPREALRRVWTETDPLPTATEALAAVKTLAWQAVEARQRPVCLLVDAFDSQACRALAGVVCLGADGLSLPRHVVFSGVGPHLELTLEVEALP